MWEAKMEWDEALNAKIKYETFQRKMDELRDEVSAAWDDWYDKRDAADVMIDNVRNNVKPLSVNLDNTAAGKDIRG